jgi:hypothetical protein
VQPIIDLTTTFGYAIIIKSFLSHDPYPKHKEIAIGTGAEEVSASFIASSS